MLDKSIFWLRMLKRRRAFNTHHSMDVPPAPRRVLRNFIAVYPEIVSGNPLGAKMAVRWLLHKPDHFFANVDRTGDALTFVYGDVVARSVDGCHDGILKLRWLRDDVYEMRNRGRRSGSAILLRKGDRSQNRSVVVPPDAVLVDGKSHAEMAQIFNRCERVYSYDPYTLLTYYAARCGCIPIIVAPENMKKSDWQSQAKFRFGHAFGDSTDEISFAKRTRLNMLERVKQEKNIERQSVENFVETIFQKWLEMHSNN